MDFIFPLSQLPMGQNATVLKILTSGTMRRRLQDLGIIPGTQIECVLKSPAGDPVAYRIRGALIALRKKDSETILMNP
ncbi:MAG: ferrous iron transport protein A [Clostridia bacterium]|nr:ferrous iron transport protein A [Clostridia bacterium]